MKKIGVQDYLLGITLLLVSLIPLLSLVGTDENNYRVLHKGQVVHTGSLSTDTTFIIAEEIVIKVYQGKIGIVENNCPNQYCIKMGTTNRSSKQIVCIPNQLIIEAIASTENDDGIEGLLR